jgi:uncharacterized membrane protein (UPF0136 family)
VAAVAQAAEALVLFAAAVFAAVATVDGKSYQRGSGVALTLITVGTAAGLAAFAVGLFRVRAWTRTPVVMTQLLVIGIGIFLLDGHRLEWAIPALALAAICLAGVFVPASLQALNRPPLDAADPPQAAAPKPVRARKPATSAKPKAATATKPRAKPQANASAAKPGPSTTKPGPKRPPAKRKPKGRR